MKDLYDINDWLNIHEHQRLGEILMLSGKINLIHLGMALDIQNFEKLQLGEILLNMKVVSQEDIEQALMLQAKLILLNMKNISREKMERALLSQTGNDIKEEGS
jgi:hypothetical protein